MPAEAGKGGISMRVGIGYDVHRLAEGRDLMLGGVKIPYDKGLLGHSDADVLLHAVMDALLGAAGLGDIGRHFPDTDPAYKGISSMRLLEKVGELLAENHFLVENIDATIIAQAPKMSPYMESMRENIARTLAIDVDANTPSIPSSSRCFVMSSTTAFNVSKSLISSTLEIDTALSGRAK